MTDFTYTVPGLTIDEGKKVAEILQARLNSMNDLHLTLKHIHWNVTGPNFIAVHEMLDPQTELVRGFADEIAERIATLGGSPVGVPGRLAYQRPWGDYSLDKASVQEHLTALDTVYDGVVKSHRDAVSETSQLDPVTEDLLVGQTRELELFQWFIRAHLENSGAK